MNNIVALDPGLRRNGAVIEKLLASASHSAPTIREVNITRLLDHVVESVDRFIGDNIIVTYNQVVGLPLVQGDPVQLRQAISNIAINAVEAIGTAEGSIHIQSGVMTLAACMKGVDDLAPGRYAFIKISDTGCGIQSAFEEKIFEPFFSTKGAGRGIGLASALSAVRAHGGIITKKSLPGYSTTFTIILPVAAKRPKMKKFTLTSNHVIPKSPRLPESEQPQAEIAFREY